jgi:cytochrome P450
MVAYQADAMVNRAATVPGPRPSPVGAFGNWLAFLRNPTFHLSQLHCRYGAVVALPRGSDRRVFAFGPDNNERVLGDPVRFRALGVDSLPMPVPKCSDLATLYSGLHQMNGARHGQQRRLLVSALYSQRTDRRHRVVVEAAEQHLDRWRQGQRFDLLREMRELSLAVAVATRLGLDPDRDGRNVFELLHRWLGLAFSPYAIALPFDLPALPYRRLLRASERLANEIRGLIVRRRAKGGARSDIMSELIRVHDEDGVRLTDDELIGQIATLFVAGHDITARVLTWTLFLLMVHPRILADVHDELRNSVSGGVLTADQLERLPLLESVLKESMRLLPPVLWWARMAAAPAELGGYAVREGAYVITSHFVTHRLPELYDRPAQFLPDRWETARPGPYEYLPFSAGPRMCPGTTLALAEMKAMLACVLRRFRLEILPGTRVDCCGPMLSAPRRLAVAAYDQDRCFHSVSVRGNICGLVEFPVP